MTAYSTEATFEPPPEHGQSALDESQLDSTLIEVVRAIIIARQRVVFMFIFTFLNN